MNSVQLITRKGATCTELLSCLYNLTPTESRIFYELLRRGPSSLDQISTAINRDRTSTHRCLQKLVGAGLAYKETMGLAGGGYYHLYSAVEPSKVKQQSKLKVREICRSLEKLIRTFEEDVQKHLAASSVQGTSLVD
jgi:predicted transcriptional regulator